MKLEMGLALVATTLSFGLGCGEASSDGQGGVGGTSTTSAGGGGEGGKACPAGSHLEDGACRSAIVGWGTGPALPQATDHHVSFIVEGTDADHLFVAGGFDGNSPVSTVFRATVDRGVVGAWQAVDPLPDVMSGHGMAIVGDRLVLTGGRRLNFFLQPATNIATISPTGELVNWTDGPPMALSRFHHSMEVHDGVVYAIGGLVGDGTDNTDNVARLTSLDGSWEDVTPLPERRSHHCSLVHEGRLYVIGGLTGNPAGSHTSHRDILRTDIDEGGALGPWSTVSELPETLATHSCFVDLGYLYVVGGVRDDVNFTDQVLRAPLGADGQLGAWESQPSLPGPRAHTHQTPKLHGYVYSAGGRVNGQSIADVFVGQLQ